jgi:lysylphosphatidylglycerol synthase-like protein
MTEQTGAKGRSFAILWLLGAVSMLALGMLSSDVRHLLAEATEKIRLAAVLATLPVQLVAVLLCAVSLRLLCPGVSFLACLSSRLLRDAGGNLLLPGFGELIGGRALVVAGARTRAVVAATALDQLAETVALLPYLGLAFYVVSRIWYQEMPRHQVATPSLALIVGLLVALGALLFCASRLGRAKDGMWKRLADRLGGELRALRAEFRRQKGYLPASIAIHFVAWAIGGLRAWAGSKALGFNIGPLEGIAIESVAYAGRAILFFIPAGLVTQEAGIVAGGLAFGLTPAQALALALVLRLRDIVFGLPLVAWPVLEFLKVRRARRVSSY